MFRHCVKIPTVKEYIEQISPGLSELTKTKDEIVFWFYSLEEKKFKKYILGGDMKITLDTNAEAYDVVNDLKSKFYFNFIQQRWERKITNKNSQRPTVDKDRHIIEQHYSLCYINEGNTKILDNNVAFNVAANTICEERRNQAFVKLKIRNVNYNFNEKTLQLELDTKSMFLTNATMCKFTMNRYKEYLNISYDQNNETDNNEIQIGVYFYRDSETDNKWILKECEKPEEMYFDGSICRQREDVNMLNAIENKLDLSKIIMATHINESDILNNKSLLSDELPQNGKDLLQSHYLKLNASHSAYVNLNVEEKIYALDVDFYKSCHYTFFIVGQKKSDISNEYEWKLEQMINDVARNKMLEIKQQWCAIIQEPRKIYNVQTGSYMYLRQPFVFYLDYIFYMRDIFLKLVKRIEDTKQYIIADESNKDAPENKNSENVQNKILLPHIRKYSIVNKHNDKCILFATFAGNTIFDIYAETRLLVDFIEDIYKHEFYNRNLFPTISNDFQLGLWACVEKVDKPEMFTYISLVDMFGLSGYATTTNKVNDDTKE